MPVEAQTIDVPPLSIRAEVGTVNADARTIDLVFTTGAPVERFDWMTGTRYIERLSLDPAHVRLDRLNASAPLLDTHSGYSLADQIGVVEPGTARIQGKRGLATVRFSKRDEVEPIWQDVRDAIVKNVSVGYMVYAYQETPGKKDAPPTRLATDWEPFEVSLVPMPADYGAQTRDGKSQVRTHPCIITRSAQSAAVSPEEQPMADESAQNTGTEQSEYIREGSPLAGAERQPPAAPAAREPNERDAGAVQERERVDGIMDAVIAVRLPLAFARKLISDGIPLVEAHKRIFKEYGTREDPTPNVPAQGPRGASVQIGEDPYTHKRAGIENALLNRVAPQHFKLEEVGREYRGMTMLDVAKAYLGARGFKTTGMSKMEIAGAALGLTQLRGSGYHTTSDFSYLLADVANKSLSAEYTAATQTFQPITRRVSLTDFKPANRIQIGDAPALHPVNEHGEFTRGTIAEGREQIQLASYGRVFAITRKALVNDDTDAFSRVPAKFGRMAKNLESDLVWYQILKNAAMGDGTVLFHSTHHNLDGTGAVISISSISDAETAMLLQTGLDSSTLIMASPKYLIVPPEQKTLALQFVSVNMQAQQAANVNPFAGQLVVIAEPRLSTGVTIGVGPGAVTAAGSSIAWYLAADPSQVDILELALLEGQEGPLVESRVGFDVDGLEIKCRHDVGAKVIDHRGLYKNIGAT